METQKTPDDSLEKKEFDFFDRPSTKKLLWILLWGACALSVLAELFIRKEHPHFKIETFFGFHAILGFLACLVSILVAKGLGYFLKVDEDYYER